MALISFPNLVHVYMLMIDILRIVKLSDGMPSKLINQNDI